MNTYRNRTSSKIYRKIYKDHYGPIPKDEHGRSYEIHHLDGDHSNNDPLNLKAVTIQEHYEIHQSQGDFSACLLMAKRMKLSPEETSELARLAVEKQLRNGTNPFTQPWTCIDCGVSGKNSGLFTRWHKDGKCRLPFRISVDHHTQQSWTCNDCGTTGKNPGLFTRWHKDGKCLSPKQPADSTHPSQRFWTCTDCGVSGRNLGNFGKYHKNGKCQLSKQQVTGVQDEG